MEQDEKLKNTEIPYFKAIVFSFKKKVLVSYFYQIPLFLLFTSLPKYKTVVKHLFTTVFTCFNV